METKNSAICQNEKVSVIASACEAIQIRFSALFVADWSEKIGRLIWFLLPSAGSQRRGAGFTLVELIVTITILAILWVIAILQFGSYLSSARDGARSSDIATISKSLDIFMARNGSYPTPNNPQSITFSWWTLWIQWTVGTGVINQLRIINKKPLDPKFGAEYAYSVVTASSLANLKSSYALAGVSENAVALDNPLFSQSFADSNPYQAYVKGNYNSLVAKTQVWTWCVTLALPSIMLASIPVSGKIEDAGSSSLVFAWKWNLPPSYAGKLPDSPAFTGSFSFRDYSTDQSSLIVSAACPLPATPTEIGIFADKMKSAYAGTSIEAAPIYAPIVTTVDSASRIMLGASIINNYLGGSIDLATQTGSLPSFFCGSQPPIVNAGTFTTGNPTSFGQTWAYANTPGNCTFTCASGYAWDSSTNSCISDVCQGSLSSLNGVIKVGTTQNFSQTWTYDALDTDTICRYTCATGYTYDNIQSKCLPNNCVTQTGTVNTHSYSIPAISHASSQNVATAPISITGGTITYAQNFSCTLGTISASWSEITNTPSCSANYTPSGTNCVGNSMTCGGSIPMNGSGTTATNYAWAGTSYDYAYGAETCGFTCKPNYTWNGGTGTCDANTQVAACTGLPASASWNTVSSVTQTWGGSSWTPANVGVYNTTASTTSCNFKCNANYTWNSGTSTCNANTQSVNCGGSIPENASPTTATVYTQTWNGWSWAPTTNWTYGAGICGFTCNGGYNWDGASACTSVLVVACSWPSVTQTDLGWGHGKCTFPYVGSVQTFTVTSGVGTINIYGWGWWGSGWGNCMSTGFGGSGAGGSIVWTVTSGTNASVYVAGGATSASNTSGNGGGATYVMSAGSPLLVLGGGWGGSWWVGSCLPWFGGNNASAGTAGNGCGGAVGGSDWNGGSYINGNAAAGGGYLSIGGWTWGGGSGPGGAGGYDNVGSLGGYGWGGAGGNVGWGGGGYSGGGAGGRSPASCWGGGWGGGSYCASGWAFSGCTLYAWNTGASGGATPGGTSLFGYSAGVGIGSTSSVLNGGNGLVVITW